MSLMKQIDVCIEISEVAMKQYTIEKNLNEMIKAWQNIGFEFVAFKNAYVIKSYDDVVALVFHVVCAVYVDVLGLCFSLYCFFQV